MDAGVARKWSTRICLDIVVKSAKLGYSLAMDRRIYHGWMDGWQASWMDGWIHGRRLVFHKICRLQSRLLNGRELEKKSKKGRQCIAGWGRDDGVVGEAEKGRTKEDRGGGGRGSARGHASIYEEQDPQYC